MSTHSSLDGRDRDNTSWVSPSSSQESLPIRSYTTIRVEALSRLHTTIANLQAEERRRDAEIAHLRVELDRLEDEIRDLENREMRLTALIAALVLVLGLGFGLYDKLKST